MPKFENETLITDKRKQSPLERLKSVYKGESQSGLSEDEMVESILRQVYGDEPPTLCSTTLDLAERVIEAGLAGEELSETGQLIELLRKNRPRIKQCARVNCGKPFLAKRKDKKGCSPKCCNIISVLKSQRLQKERAEQYKVTTRYRATRKRKRKTK